MANAGSIGLAVGAALIGLGAVFAAFLAMRVLSGLVKAVGSRPMPPATEAPQNAKTTPAQPKPQVAAPSQVAQVTPQPQAAAPAQEVAAAIGIALSLHGAGEEIVAAIATALALEGIGGKELPSSTGVGSLWSSAGRIDAHGRRLAIQSRLGR